MTPQSLFQRANAKYAFVAEIRHQRPQPQVAFPKFLIQLDPTLQNLQLLKEKEGGRANLDKMDCNKGFLFTCKILPKMFVNKSSSHKVWKQLSFSKSMASSGAEVIDQSKE